MAAISGPWTLFNPAFGLDELVDPALMRRQAVVFGDVILANSWVPRVVLAGLDPVYRLGRALLGANPLGLPPLDPLGLASDLVASLSELPGTLPSVLPSPATVAPASTGGGGPLSARWFCGLL